ncbi:phosphohistidine phosphatase [Cohaesibacter celericrescens]|uniref:Phosphohistidine phosphatase n=2 Tax=Cohaesibacter celericrescens TaxID=2067669 RepID=A0A2N5XLS9_9HYPH|nr:phosphohistidine phosphatase [Cohaesibacter celericrescens]PLW78859.1 phosphohistidine phosphatase [Cohaesibacter celericrescens]
MMSATEVRVMDPKEVAFMLRLFLLRHAKSSWSDPDLHDFDRPLNKRGKKDPPKIALAMKERGYCPDRILCSSSMRTKETLGGILPGLQGDVSLKLLDDLYEGHAPDYLVIMRAHAKDSNNLMIVGHNTGLHEIALRLITNTNTPLATDMEIKFPTSALAVIDFDCDSWNMVTAQSGQLIDFIKPRDIAIDMHAILLENPAPAFFRR